MDTDQTLDHPTTRLVLEPAKLMVHTVTTRLLTWVLSETLLFQRAALRSHPTEEDLPHQRREDHQREDPHQRGHTREDPPNLTKSHTATRVEQRLPDQETQSKELDRSLREPLMMTMHQCQEVDIIEGAFELQ